jgi:hypothetical protein
VIGDSGGDGAKVVSARLAATPHSTSFNGDDSLRVISQGVARGRGVWRAAEGQLRTAIAVVVRASRLADRPLGRAFRGRLAVVGDR